MKLFEHQLEEEKAPLSIKILGLGGAGHNHLEGLNLTAWGDSVETLALNTDVRTLQASTAQKQYCVGKNKLKGLGAGGEMSLAREAALEDLNALEEMLKGADVVCLLAGLGGGTGAALAPMLAEIATEQGAFVLAFVSLPFPFEGTRRHKLSEESLQALRASCDVVVPLPNTLLLQQAQETETICEAFAQGVRWIDQALQALLQLLLRPGLINLELSHLKQTFHTHGGRALFGLGHGSGPDATQQALESLSLCPLLHLPEAAQKADRLLIQCIGGPDLSLSTVHTLGKTLAQRYSSTQQTLLAAAIDPKKEHSIQICVLGTTSIGARKTIRRRSWSAAPTPTPPPNATSTKPQQAHFDFFHTPSRAGFATAPPHDTQDLDVPTYLRRGIRISL